METITLTINGATIRARAGKTVLEVARQHGIHIPTLCHHDALRPIGACRLCQVEDEKRGMVVPACVTKVGQDMMIATDSERVRRNRKNILRLLMAAHPESCILCEKGNTCELRKLTAEYGIGDHGLDRMAYHPTVFDLNPFMARDLSKCIMCAKCVRADQEVVCEGVIDYHFRGFDAHPATLYSDPLETTNCTFCGTCMTVCPVGAIAEKERPRQDHAGKKTLSVCSFCGCGCSVYLKHDGQTVRFVSPTQGKHTPNGISMCVRGHFGHDYLVSRDRLIAPLVRKDGELVLAGWDEALDRIAEGIKAAMADGGANSVGFMGGARNTNEENFMFQKLARQVVGTNNIDHASRFLWGPILGSIQKATGFSAGSVSFAGVEGATAVLVIGTDPTKAAPVLGYHIKRAAKYNGATLIAADPMKSKPAGLANVWLKMNVGSDAALLKGMIKIILDEELGDKQFVAANTNGFDEFKAAFENVNPAECAADAGIPEGDLVLAAREFAKADSGVVVFGDGLAGQPDAADLGCLIADLVLITGNLGKDNAGFVPVFTDANAQGALDMGVAPDMLPGGAPTNDGAGLDQAGMLQAAVDGGLKALYIFGENTAAAFPDGNLAASGLEAVPFLVVQDLFMTETAKYADVVLPSTAWAEKPGSVTNIERRVQPLKHAVPSPSGYPPDWEILWQLARRLGGDWGYRSLADVRREIEKTVSIYTDVFDADMTNTAVFWPMAGVEEVMDTLPHGIGTPDGKGVFLSPNGGSGVPGVGDGFPFVLIQGSILNHLGGGVRSGKSRRLAKASPGPFLEISPEDMRALGLENDQKITVSTATGHLTVPVRESAEMPEGAVFLPAAFAEARPNLLFDVSSGNRKFCRVKIEKSRE